MQRGVERLEEILREFRDFVVATQLTPTSCDINEVVREAASETFPKRSPVQLQLVLDDCLPAVLCDPKRIKRALSELIENALSFQPEGGSLRLTTFIVSPEARTAQRLGQGRAYVGIECADSGPGVPGDQKERIFLPFHTTRAKGMGLGLSIVKGIVEAHQGLVRETGSQGKGATFTVFLPTGESEPTME